MPTKNTIRSFYMSETDAPLKTTLPTTVEATTPKPALTSNTEVLADHFDIEDITAKIQSYQLRFVESAYEIGRLLTRVKDRLAHGEWLDWLRDRINFSERTAHRFMRLANGYSNSTTLANLGLSKALTLLALQEDERDAFIEDTHEVNGETKDVSEMSTRELEKVIRDHKDKRNKEASLISEAVQESNSDKSPEATENNGNTDIVTLLMKKVVYLGGFLGEMLESLEKQVDNNKEQYELTTLLHDVLSTALQKLSDIPPVNEEPPA